MTTSVNSSLDSTLVGLPKEASAPDINELIFRLFTDTISNGEKNWLEKNFSSKCGQISAVAIDPLQLMVYTSSHNKSMNASWVRSVKAFLQDRGKLEKASLNLHTVLVTIMQKMGYIREGGYCYGVARMGMRAIMLGQATEFNARLEKLAAKMQEHADDAEKTLADIQTNDRLFYNDLRAFFDGMALQQSPQQYLDLSETPRIRQEYSPELYNLVQPDQKQEMEIITAFSGMYKERELTGLLTELQNIAADKPLCLQLSVEGHALFASYNPNTKEWHYLDANYLPIHVVKDANSVVNMIKTSNRLLGREKQPHEQDFIGLNIEIISTKEQKKDVTEKLMKLLRTDKWQHNLYNISKISPERLRLAVYLGEKEVIKWMINKNSTIINKQNNEGLTALLLAIGRRHTETAEVLLGIQTTDVNLATKEGITPLMEAVVVGDIPMIKNLVAHGANVTRVDVNGETALMKAVRTRNIEAIKELLSVKKIDVNCQNNEGWTPLMIASKMGCADIVQLLLDNGAKASVQNKRGWTPLMIASEKGCADIVQLLLDNGAKASVQNREGNTALMVAVKYGFLDVVRALLRVQGDVDDWVDLGTIDMINQQNAQGYTALMLAVESQKEDIVHLLLEQEADVTFRNAAVKTAYDLAQSANMHKAIQDALKKNIDEQDAAGMTALMRAVQDRDIEKIRMLMIVGNANIELKNKKKQTALQMAQKLGYKDIANAIIICKETRDRGTPF